MVEKSPSEKLVHDMRNTMALLQMGVGALRRSRTDERAFNDTHAEMTNEIKRLNDQVEEIARLLPQSESATRGSDG